MSLDYLYIGLLNVSAVGLVEIPQDETNYRRIEMGPGDWFFLDEDSKENITNAINVVFPTASELWGTISHFGIFDSLKEGKLLLAGALQAIGFITQSSKLEFKAGKINIPVETFEQIKMEIRNG